MPVKRIFLDIDGVLNDWQFHAMKLMGAPVEHYDYDKWNPEIGWDIVRAFNELTFGDNTDAYYTAPQFWDEVPQDSWHTCPLSREASDIVVTAAAMVDRGEVYVLTSPTRDPMSAAGKMIWINKHFPQLNRNLIIGAAKHVCAQPGHLLVDDSDDNCTKFIAAGGEAILLPRPWNVRHTESTREVIPHELMLAA